MLIRYVIGRPIAPTKPKVLKSGSISKDVRSDTTEALYLRACEVEQVEPDQGYVHHLRQRDLHAWVYRLDIVCTDELMSAALYDAQKAQAAIAKAPALPPRNGWACQRCRWRSHCEGDPMATHAGQWLDVAEGRPPTPLAVKHGRNTYRIKRERPGFVVSPSELRSWLTCPRLWHLEYARRLRRVVESKKALPRLRGSLTHEAIRLLTKNPNVDLRLEVELAIKELAEAGALEYDAQSELIAADQVEAIADRARSMFDLAMSGVAEVVEYEQRRIMRMPGSKKWLHGIPDAVVRMEDGRLAVIEYKTTSYKNLPNVADGYRTDPGVHLYAALLQHGQLATS